MKSLSPARTASSIAGQVLIVGLGGLALASLVVNASILLIFGALLAIAFFIVFLQRPDLGLLTVLLVRASTDISFWIMGGILVDRRGLAGALPNVGLVLILILAGGLFVLSRSVPLLKLPGGTLLALLLVAGLVGTLRSESVVASFNEWLPVVSAFIVYALAAHLFRGPRRIQMVIDVLAASFVLPALFGFYQLATGEGLQDRIGLTRVYGTFVHPNAFALYLVMILSVFACQTLVHSGKRKLLALSVVVASGILLVATFARISWVGAAVVLLTIGALRSRILLILAPVVALVGVGIIPAIGFRLSDPLGGSFADRVDLWLGALREWGDATGGEPLLSVALSRLAGLGPGSVDILTARVRGTAFAAHNDYLRVLFEYGIFGLALFVVLSIVLIISAYRAWRSSTDKTMASVTLSFLALALAYPIMSITDNIFAATQNQAYFWTLAGLAASIGRTPIHASESQHWRAARGLASSVTQSS